MEATEAPAYVGLFILFLYGLMVYVLYRLHKIEKLVKDQCRGGSA